MKLNYKYTLLITTAIVAVGCRTQKGITIEGLQSAIEIPAKKVFTEDIIRNWSYADLAKDSIPGISLQKAYDFLKDKQSETVIVAVADSGTDIDHIDLKSVLWINSKEIPNNQIDDDKNGFIDDIHGWNFLGNTYDETLEITRLYKSLKPLYEGKTEKDFKGAKLDEFLKFKLIENDFKMNFERVSNSQRQYSQYLQMLEHTHKNIQKLTGKDDYKLSDVKKINSTDEMVLSQKDLAVKVLESATTFEEQIKQVEPAVNHYTSQVNFYYNVNFDGRTQLGDNAYTMDQKIYGDNNVKDHGEDEIHGTHVSGIILADRNNSQGIQGIANNAKLMSVRVVPNGDEYDKDIALGIRYAVDNGAKIINCSFGKSYSPKAEWVYDAIKYAESKDVLIVHAAGNDAKNIDLEANFPTDAPDFKKEIASNLITVGASTRFYDENLLANFSNFGKNNVDIFAPGHDIYATVLNNEYQNLSGTSMASPTVAGVAALIRSYFPSLKASEVKEIIMNSGTLITMDVLIPGESAMKTKLSSLSKTGRILNAYNAVRLAAAYQAKK